MRQPLHRRLGNDLRVKALVRLLSTIAVACGPATVGHAATFQCPSASVEIEADAEASAEPACTAARRAVAVLARCYIKASKPIKVRVHRAGLEVRGFLVFGAYDAGHGTAHATDLATCTAMMSVYPDLRSLDPAEFYVSVIAHEVAHAIAQQSLDGRPLDVLLAEYIAFAVQVASMPEPFRNAFLAAQPVAGPVQWADLNTTTLLSQPFLFGAMAHRHFSTEPNRCATLRGILTGKAATSGEKK